MTTSIFLLILGLILLIVSGDFLVKGAVGIAKKFDISPLVIGMTVVSFGTSAPELFVSVKAALDGVPAIAVGNVVGSNIANISLILGITVLIFPIIVDRNSKFIDWPMMMFASILCYLFAMDNLIQWWEGLVMVVILIAFVVYIVQKSRKNKSEVADQELDAPKKEWITYVFLFGGLVGLKFGADWMLDGAIGIATIAGMSEKVIGVTIIAFGTSVPELVASAVAAYRQQTDISIGNLIGSNIFNIMVVLGLTAIIKEIEVEPSIMSFDMFWMLGIAIALLPLMLFGKKLGRAQGIIMTFGYCVYIYLCVLQLKG